MTGASRRTGKSDALHQISSQLGIPVPDSLGGTVPKIWLRNVLRVVGGEGHAKKKRGILREIFEQLGGPWEDDYVTEAGSTVTGEALWVLHDLLTQDKVSNMTDVAPESASVEDVENEFEEELNEVASALSRLSQADVFPEGYKGQFDPFEALDVSFASLNWLERIYQVRAWLRLDTALTKASDLEDPRRAAIELFEELAPDSARHCLELADGYPSLTLLGAQQLTQRLESAESLQGRFLDTYEALDSLRAATRDWEESWNQETTSQDSTGEPIFAETEKWLIRDFAGWAAQGLLELSPSYQRGDVWSKKDSQQLIESVLRGIPLPSVILLSGEGPEDPWEVVDGKQRLTAILRFAGAHPEALRRIRAAEAAAPEGVEFLESFQADYPRFKRLWSDYHQVRFTDALEAENYFPFKLRNTNSSEAYSGPLAGLDGKYYTQIKNSTVDIAGRPTKIQNLFGGQNKYDLPVIIYSNTKPRQIHEVFKLYNKQGKHLNPEELRNAVYHELRIVRLLLAAAGDARRPLEIVDFLDEPRLELLPDISEVLSEYRVGESRYKRTKILSWITALLFQNAIEDKFKVRATSKHIDNFFSAIQEASESHEFNRAATLARYVDDLHRTLNAHAESIAWAYPEQDSKWHELQLVTTLTATFLLGQAVDDPASLLDERLDEIHNFTSAHGSPDNHQTATQWGFIGKVVTGIIEAAGLSLSDVSQSQAQNYGADCIPTMLAASDLYKAPKKVSE